MINTKEKQITADLGFFKSLIYACGEFGGNIANIVFGYVLFFYTDMETIVREKPLLSMGVMTFILVAGRIIDGLADPLVGYWSDKTRTRIGRRRPFIVLGAPLLAISFVMLFVPLFPAGSSALAVSTFVTIGLFWFFFTVVMGPYLALMPEITKSTKQRIQINTFTAVAFLLATGFKMMIFSKMVDANAWNMGFVKAAIIGAVLVVAFLWIAGFGTKEKFDSSVDISTKTKDKKQPEYSFKDAMVWTFKNKAFATYILSSVCFKLGTASIMSCLPFIVTRLMKKSLGYESTVALSIVPGIIVSFFILNALTKRYGKVLLYKVCLLLFALIFPLIFFVGRVNLIVDPAMAGLIIMLLISFPLAGDMLLPKAILADITDEDFKNTGNNREAMYFGMQGLLQKIATSGSKVVQGALFAVFGYSMTNFMGISLLGPVAGGLVFIGFIIFLFYPLDDRPDHITPAPLKNKN